MPGQFPSGESELDVYEVAIIGAGPAGLTAALVCGRQQRRVLLLDSGMPRNARATELHMLVGRDGHSPARLRQTGREEVARHPNVRIEDATVRSAAAVPGGFRLELASGAEEARKLILATGQVDVLPDVPGLAERFGSSVFHCPYCHGFEVKDRSVVVLGGGYAHCMQALYLADRLTSDVVVCTHGATPEESLLKRLARAGITVHTEPLAGVDGGLGDLRLSFASGRVVRCEAVFHRTATRQHSDLAERLGCEMLPDGRVRVDAVQQTTVPGVYAAGDMARQETLPEATAFLATGAADGLRAAIWADQELLNEDAEVAAAAEG
ncbi:NAD(P)/FAD-dependent oxidoreductase [Streptomyces sp. NPDC050732]|uniref:NAD(P)/FAD-dependent oxidoreductase n=1 Tax=Streptomyces sp. NPDC050732 TaxID=3154632 RepID=UPI003418697B